MRSSIRNFAVFVLSCLVAAPLLAQPAKTTPPPTKPAQPPLVGESSLRIYAVPGGNAEGIVKLFQEVFKEAPKVRIVPLNAHQMAVWAGSEEHGLIAKQQALTATSTEVIALTNLDASKIAPTLRAVLGEPPSGGPFIGPDGETNALIIRGTEEHIRDVKEMLGRLGEGGARPSSVRVINLDQGSAASLAEALGELLPKLRANPVKLILPGKSPDDPAPANPPKKEPDKKDAKVGTAAPIHLTAFGNRMIVTTEDPQAMTLVGELVRLLKSTRQGDFEVIRLKHGAAANVARVLDEAFNGPARTLGGIGPHAERIRVVADPATNTLLLKANGLDTMTIRNLVARTLDTPGAAARSEPAQKETKKVGVP